MDIPRWQLLTGEHAPPPRCAWCTPSACSQSRARLASAHAWVERGTACLFVGLYRGARVLCSVERPAHYEHLRVQHRTKYTPWQAARENQRTVSYGPWKPQYRALIRQEPRHWTDRASVGAS